MKTMNRFDLIFPFLLIEYWKEQKNKGDLDYKCDM